MKIADQKKTPMTMMIMMIWKKRRMKAKTKERKMMTKRRKELLKHNNMLRMKRMLSTMAKTTIASITNRLAITHPITIITQAGATGALPPIHTCMRHQHHILLPGITTHRLITIRTIPIQDTIQELEEYRIILHIQDQEEKGNTLVGGLGQIVVPMNQTEALRFEDQTR
mmetsp:Transcript_75670/g.219742  ORF Transcript_75670/g.219742 Transcript_75670/m.219742 type:complete len:169 (-) Transcript_75670:1276-1782(-)